VSQPKEKLIIFILMVTIMIDIMGLGLIFPIIPGFTLDTNNTVFLDPNTSEFARYTFYGLIMAAWPFGLFIGSSVIGRLSDVYGRKRLLIISLIGIASSYMLSVLAVYISDIYLFTFSRLTVGLFGGCFGLAQTIIIDITPKERLTRNLSFVTLAASVGMIFGPLLTTLVGKIYQNNDFLSAMLPCLIGAVITIINLISVSIFLKETNKNKAHASKLNFIDMIFSFRKMFSDSRIVLLAISFLFMQVAWGFYIQSFPLIMSSRFDLNQAQIGLSFVFGSIGYLVTILGILPRLERYCSLKSLVVFNAFLVGITFLLSCAYPTVIIEYITFVVTSMFQVLFYSAILTWISGKVDDHEQGVVMGGTVSIFGIAWAINALLISVLVSVDMFLPIYLAAFFFILSGLIALKVTNVKTHEY
jgi:MFS family permease